MFGMGMPELIFIGLFGLLVFGPRKLPEIGRKVGEIMGQLRRVSDDFKQTWETEVQNEKVRGLDVDVPPARPAVSSAVGTAPTIAPPQMELENTLSRSPFKAATAEITDEPSFAPGSSSVELQSASPARSIKPAMARAAVIDGYEG